MSAKALTWLRTQKPCKANGAPDHISKLILYALADMHNDKDKRYRLFPSQALISERTSLGTSTVSKYLHYLEGQGYLQRTRRHHKGGARQGQRTSDEFVLNLERPADDLTLRGSQPPALRRRTDPNQFGPRSGHRDEPAVLADRGAFSLEYSAPRHGRGRSSWSATDVADEVNDRFMWAFGRSPLKRDPWLIHLAGIRRRLGTFPRIEANAVDSLFEDETVLVTLSTDLKAAPSVVLVAIADAYICARETNEPDIQAAVILTTDDGRAKATDGTVFGAGEYGRRRRDEHDRALERRRLGLST